jgi:hypothetical protein
VGGAGAVELKQPARDCGFHSLNHGVKGDNCCDGGRDAIGGVKEGPTCYTGKPYWGAAKKACGVDQYGAPPMYGSRKASTAGGV